MGPPPDDDAPSRRDFEQLSTAVQKLTTIIEELPERVAAIYVRQDLYDKDQRLHDKTHQELETELKGLTSARDWAIKIIVGAVLVALLGLVLSQGG